MRFDVRAYVVVPVKLYAKLEYIPHVSLSINVDDAHDIINNS